MSAIPARRFGWTGIGKLLIGTGKGMWSAHSFFLFTEAKVIEEFL